MYDAFLKQLLAPLGIYRTEGGVSGGEISALGVALDGAHAVLGELERELFIGSAESFGLTNYESLLPLKPAYRTVGERRNALMGLIRMDGASFTLEAVNKTLCGCGIPAEATEAEEPMTVTVSFPGTRGIPENIEQLKAAIEQIIPCHLGISYFYVYTPWSYLESCFATWDDIENLSLTWAQLETYL